PTPPLVPYTTLFRSEGRPLRAVDDFNTALQALMHQVIDQVHAQPGAAFATFGGVEGIKNLESCFRAQATTVIAVVHHQLAAVGRSEEHTSELQSREQ